MRRFLLALPWLLVACASDNFDTAAEPADAASDSELVDTATLVDSAALDTAPPLDTPPPDCDPTEVASDSDTIFVATTGNDMGDGTSTQPLLTVTAAIARAVTNGKAYVRIAKGVYVVQVGLPNGGPGITVEGGWNRGATWTRNCSGTARDDVLLSSPNRIGVTIEARTGPVTFRTLGIETRAAKATTDVAESMIGVLVRGNVTVLLDDVKVTATTAGDGPPATLSIGSSTPACGGLSDCSDGGNGGNGGNGSAAGIGTFSGNGYTPVDGSPGTPGSPGRHGTAGPPAPTVTCVDCSPGVCLSTTTCMVSVATVTPGRGKCGCGGNGGSAGGGGHGGGASVALLAAGAAKVTVQRAMLRAGNGGNGSAGKSGVEGAFGTVGTPSMGTTCSTSCSQFSGLSCSGSTPYYCINGTPSTTRGEAGGTGGRGGAGGQGGPAAGGPSYGIVTVAGAIVGADATTIVHGSGGTGAKPGPAATRADL